MAHANYTTNTRCETSRPLNLTRPPTTLNNRIMTIPPSRSTIRHRRVDTIVVDDRRATGTTSGHDQSMNFTAM